MPVRFGVLLSGGGTNFQAIADNVKKGVIPGEIALVLSDHKDAYGLVRAEKMGISHAAILRREYKDSESYYRAMIEKLDAANVDYLLLAGFMRILPAFFTDHYKRRILNIHPSLIPKFSGKGFYGEHVHEAVIAAGEKVSGATVHFVDAGCDTGEIILQREVPVLPDDTAQTLAKRVLETEHEIYTEAILRVLKEDQDEKSAHQCI